MVSNRKRDRFYNILHLPKKPQTFPSSSARTSTSIEQETSTPLVRASASHKQLASNKLASDIPVAGIASDTTFITPKATSIPVSSSLSSTSHIATVQQTTPVSPQPIDRIALLPLIKTPHKNPRVVKAQEELQKATEELQAELLKYEAKFPSHTLVKDEDITSSDSLPTQNAADFGKVVQQAISDHEIEDSTIGGKVMRFMEKVYPIANIVLGIVSFGADVAGLAPLKLTANTLNVIVNQAAKQQTRSNGIIDCLNKLDKYQSFFENINKLGNTQLSDNLLEVSTNLLAAIMGSLRISLASLRTNFVINMAKAVGGDEFAGSQQALTTAIEALDRAIQQELLFDEKERKWNDECEKTLDFLSEISASKMHANIRNRRFENSGRWIIKNEIFQRWVDGNLKTLWCPGKPGAGKTFLASVIIDHCQTVYRSSNRENKSIGIAWMYFDYKDQNTNSMDQVIACLTRQLIASVAPEIGRSIMADATEFRKKHKSGSPGPNDYFMLLSKVVGGMRKSIVILDALDECADTDSKGVSRRWLIDSLLKLGVQMLVTSRDMPIIRVLFEQAPDSAVLAISPASQDIESYIQWRIYDTMYGSSTLRDLIKENQSLLEEITQVVVKKYSEIFNLARLQMDVITKLTTTGDVREALETLPMEESEFYDQAIERIKNQKRHSDKAFRILAWTLCAKRPLSVREMQLAAAIKPREYRKNFEDFTLRKNDIVDFSEGLILVNSDSGTVAFAHLTIIEYLQSASKRIFPTEPEKVIASTCLTYLSFHPFKSGSCTSDAEFESRLEQNVLLDYASRHWGQHAEPVQEQVLDEVFIFLKDDNLVSCSVQAMSASRLAGYSQEFPKQTTGLHLTARFGLLYLSERLLQLSENMDVSVDKYDGFNRTPLSWAAENGHEAVVKLLLEQKAEVDLEDDDGETPLSMASQNGHVAVVKLLLEHEVEVNLKNRLFNLTPLSLAALYGYDAIVKLLLEHKAEVDSKDRYSLTPLSWAARNGHETVVELLLEHKAEVDSKDGNDQTPLSWAAKNGHEAIVKLLLDQKAEVDSKDNGGQTPLSMAAESGHGAVVKLLLEHKAEVDSKDRYSLTPLSWAARNGHETVVELLLEQKAEIDSKDEEYSLTPLLRAARNGHEAVVKLLLEQKAEVDSKDKNGRTPLSMAAESGHEAVVKLLLEQKAEVDLEDDDGQTPLSWASQNGHLAVVNLLLEQKAEINSKDGKHRRTPLSLAAKNGHEAVVKLLLDQKAEVDLKDREYDVTPLSMAANSGHEAIVKLILEQEVEVNLKDIYGHTPLSMAAWGGHKAVVKMLLDQKAEVNLKDEYDRTPLSWASGGGHKAIVELLLEYKAEVDLEDDDGQTPLSWASQNGHVAVVELLLNQKADVGSKDRENGWTPLRWASMNNHTAVVKLLRDWEAPR